MLVDAHVHIMTQESLPEGNRRSFANMWAWYRGFEFTGSRRRPIPPIDQQGPWRDVDAVMDRVGVSVWDPEGEDLMKSMDVLGIEKCVSMAVDWGLAWDKEMEWTPWQVNEHASQLTKRYPNRYYFCAGIDPRRRDAADLTEKVIRDLGAVGIKLLPANGYYPNDEMCYPIYEVARAYKVPVVIHTGTGDVAAYADCVHPYHVEKPAKSFPDVQFVLAHAGGDMDGLWREVLMMAQFIPNIAVDLAEWQYVVQPSEFDPGREQEFIHTLNILRRNLGAHNIMIGTDYMKGHHLDNDQFFIDLFKELPERARRFGYNFSEEVAQLMRGDNARRIYGLG